MHLLGASYSPGTIDVWDISATDGSFKQLKNITHGGMLPKLPKHRVHQFALDPTGCYFTVPDLGGDLVHIVDPKDDAFEFSPYHPPKGCGPRHSCWIPNHDTPTQYATASELSNQLILFTVAIQADGKISMTQVEAQSTYGPGSVAANATTAAAGEVIVASNKEGVDIYVSNRVSGSETESISHVTVTDSKPSSLDQFSSGGRLPRMMSLSPDNTLLYVANMNGKNGLVALKRNARTSPINAASVAVYENSAFPLAEGADSGLQFVREVPI